MNYLLLSMLLFSDFTNSSLYFYSSLLRNACLLSTLLWKSIEVYDLYNNQLWNAYTNRLVVLNFFFFFLDFTILLSVMVGNAQLCLLAVYGLDTFYRFLSRRTNLPFPPEKMVSGVGSAERNTCSRGHKSGNLLYSSSLCVFLVLSQC